MTPTGWLGELGLDRPASGWPAMGVRADDRPWPEPADEDRLAERRRIAGEHPETIGALAGSEEAVAEVAALVRAFSGSTRPESGRLAPENARSGLFAAAVAQGDDVCILAPEPRWPLVAGAVLFPSHWRLADKLGLPLADVHERVPGYPAAQVDRFLDRLRLGQVAWRRNLLLHRDGELHAPDVADTVVPVADWWLRSERQTFRRLPRSGAVLFTIHTDTVPLRDLDAPVRNRLADRLDAMPPTWAPYAGVGEHLPGLIAWLGQ